MVGKAVRSQAPACTRSSRERKHGCSALVCTGGWWFWFLHVWRLVTAQQVLRLIAEQKQTHARQKQSTLVPHSCDHAGHVWTLHQGAQTNPLMVQACNKVPVEATEAMEELAQVRVRRLELMMTPLRFLLRMLANKNVQER